MELTAEAMLVRDFAIALAIGALVGVEREKHREQVGRGAAGLRSFMLIAETGAAAAWLAQKLSAPWLLGVVLLALTLLIGPLSAPASPPRFLRPARSSSRPKASQRPLRRWWSICWG